MKKIFPVLPVLTVLFTTFFLISPVKAEIISIPYQSAYILQEQSCTSNLFSGTIVEEAYFTNSSSTYSRVANNKSIRSTVLIPVSSGSVYTIKTFSLASGSSQYIDFYNSSSNAIQQTKINSSDSFTFTVPSGYNYVGFYLYSSSYNLDQNIMMNEGSSLLEFVDYSTSCSPSPPANESIYSNFLTLYFDRFNYLANGFTTNPYLLTMIGIILAWVVLELLLHIIHIRGGYKK